MCFHNKPGFNRREETKKKLTGQIKRRCNANANFANSAAPKITVNLFSLKHRDPLGSTEAIPDTGAETSLVGVNIIQRLGIELDDNGSKPTCAILLCSWEKHFTALSPAWWS